MRCAFFVSSVAGVLSGDVSHAVDECMEESVELQTRQPASATWAEAAWADTAAPRRPPATVSLDGCSLPANAAWAEVHTNGQQPFYMAVYATNDVVSWNVRMKHNWEHVDTALYGPPGHAYDVGGNIGFYTFVLAKAGWNITTFEPMPSNLAMINATLCANPDVRDRIDLHPIGLGNATSHCLLFSDGGNKGDGTLNCGKGFDTGKGTVSDTLPEGYSVRGEFDIKRLDDVMHTFKFAQQHVDFVKIDVEGFECNVFAGGSKLLAQHPRLIQSEVWQNMQGCTSGNYLKLFTDARYELKADVRCKRDAPASGPPKTSGTFSALDYWMCTKHADAKGVNEHIRTHQKHADTDAVREASGADQTASVAGGPALSVAGESLESALANHLTNGDLLYVYSSSPRSANIRRTVLHEYQPSQEW